MLLAAAALLSLTSVSPVELAHLVRYSDAIVVGRVTAIREARRAEQVVRPKDEPFFPVWRTRMTYSIAEVEVLQTLKGDPSLETYHYFAASTWICDTTTAELGEVGLYFLGRATLLDDEPEALRASAASASAGAPLYRVQWAGRGRMSLERDDAQQEWIQGWYKVELPESLAALAVEPGDWKLERELLTGAITRFVAAQRPVLAFTHTGSATGLSVRAEVDRQGLVWCEFDEPDYGPSTYVAQIERDRWKVLHAATHALMLEYGSAEHVIANDGNERRTVTTTGGGRDSTVTIVGKFDGRTQTGEAAAEWLALFARLADELDGLY